ncbi:hypothetical protein [Methylotuvimicrobium sp. KM2]|uniref:YrrC family ATP-dependent DNA helicase n=1 Tax=Methylotuvimicrobium sp. KM2 TaxID=3133976 RepID=UPI003100FA70
MLRVKVKGQRELQTVVGSAASVTAGEFIECTGHWNNDRQHGLQFKAAELQIVPPTTLEGIEKYLGSGTPSRGRRSSRRCSVSGFWRILKEN